MASPVRVESALAPAKTGLRQLHHHRHVIEGLRPGALLAVRCGGDQALGWGR
jgi:hypothetical protein